MRSIHALSNAEHWALCKSLEKNYAAFKENRTSTKDALKILVKEVGRPISKSQMNHVRRLLGLAGWHGGMDDEPEQGDLHAELAKFKEQWAEKWAETDRLAKVSWEGFLHNSATAREQSATIANILQRLAALENRFNDHQEPRLELPMAAERREF